MRSGTPRSSLLLHVLNLFAHFNFYNSPKHHVPGDSIRDLFIPYLEVTSNHLKGSRFHHPKKVTKNCQVFITFKIKLAPSFENKTAPNMAFHRQLARHVAQCDMALLTIEDVGFKVSKI